MKKKAPKLNTAGNAKESDSAAGITRNAIVSSSGGGTMGERQKDTTSA